eukprot:TRINITY_DN11285_c0_g1_i1.p1 TRINITY_DN11285_c0_g1~~TRINITY_DN11285_c0_g1_i1.p1  ORF type:complete len:445 (+),score=149.44 TRINITY_DN11285_c0_g1_i1:181-1515(+)
MRSNGWTERKIWIGMLFITALSLTIWIGILSKRSTETEGNLMSIDREEYRRMLLRLEELGGKTVPLKGEIKALKADKIRLEKEAKKTNDEHAEKQRMMMEENSIFRSRIGDLESQNSELKNKYAEINSNWEKNMSKDQVESLKNTRRREAWNGFWRKNVDYKREYVRPYNNDEKGMKEGTDRRLVLFFVPTPADRENKRNLIRATYRYDMPPDSDLFFVTGKPKNDAEAKNLKMENLAFGDVLSLDHEEGMDNGRTYQTFLLIEKLFGRNSSSSLRYDFVVKADDDTFLIFPQLTDWMNSIKRKRAYFGLVHHDPTYHIQGRAYGLSWDLVEWISQSEFARENNEGNEDLVTGSWMLKFFNGSHSEWIHSEQFGDYRPIVSGGIDFDGVILHNAKSQWEWLDVVRQKKWGRRLAWQDWYKAQGSTGTLCSIKKQGKPGRICGWT